MSGSPALAGPGAPLLVPRARRITGVVLSGLVGLFMIGASAIPKFIDWPGKAAMMEHLGLPLALVPTIGAIEIAVTLLYLIPRTSFVGAVLLTAHLGGAVATHLRVADHWCFPVIIGVLAWAGLALRRPLILQLALGRTGGIPRPLGAQP